MKEYDFDQLIERRGTSSVKYDLTERLYGSNDVLPMWVADMDFEVPDFIRKALQERLDHPIYGYTFRGESFHRAVQSWMKSRHQWEVDPKHVVFSPGIVPALVYSILSYTNEGDKILLQSPVYFPFFSTITDNKREVVNNKLIHQDGCYEIDFEDLEIKFQSGVKLMLFCNPHNPVGRVWKREDLQKIAALALKYKVIVISDEIHSDLVLFGHKHVPFASLGKEIADLTITCMAPSKTFNLAGFHSSALIIENDDLRRKYEKVSQVLHVTSGNLFGSVALEAAYTHGEDWLEQLLRYLEANYLFLKETLASELPQLLVSPLEATYLVWMNFELFGLETEELYALMKDEAKLGLSEGKVFGEGGDPFMRMNIGVPRKVLEQGLKRLVDTFGKLSVKV